MIEVDCIQNLLGLLADFPNGSTDHVPRTVGGDGDALAFVYGVTIDMNCMHATTSMQDALHVRDKYMGNDPCAYTCIAAYKT